jgi:hypothetical protein
MHLKDGYYVVGEGTCCPVDSRAEGFRVIEELQRNMKQPTAYAVVCYDDYREGEEPTYTMATHGTFRTRVAAEAYALTVAQTRKPIVVSLYASIRCHDE